MTTFDFNKLLKDAKAGAAWPIGEYDMEIVQADAKVASTGSNMIVVKFRCLVGPYANKHVTNNFVLSPDSPTALNIFFRNMAAFGLDESFFARLGDTDLSPIAGQLVGKRAKITLGHRQWNGGTQNEVKTIKPLTGDISGMAAQPNSAPIAPPPSAPVSLPIPNNVTPQTLTPENGVTIPPPPVSPYAEPANATPAPAPVAAVAETPTPAVVETPATPALPPGYTQEVWDMLPQAARDAVLQAQSQLPV